MMSSVQLSPESWLQKYFWMGTWQYVTIWHPRPAKYAPFCIMYNKSTYQSIAFVHFHVYRINVLHVLYFVLFSKNPIFFFFFFLRFSKKKKNLTTSISQKNSRNRSEKKNPRFLQPLTHRHWDKKEKSSREFIIETSGNFHSLGTFLLIFL